MPFAIGGADIIRPGGQRCFGGRQIVVYEVRDGPRCGRKRYSDFERLAAQLPEASLAKHCPKRVWCTDRVVAERLRGLQSFLAEQERRAEQCSRLRSVLHAFLEPSAREAKRFSLSRSLNSNATTCSGGQEVLEQLAFRLETLPNRHYEDDVDATLPEVLDRVYLDAKQVGHLVPKRDVTRRLQLLPAPVRRALSTALTCGPEFLEALAAAELASNCEWVANFCLDGVASVELRNSAPLSPEWQDLEPGMACVLRALPSGELKVAAVFEK